MKVAACYLYPMINVHRYCITYTCNFLNKESFWSCLIFKTIFVVTMQVWDVINCQPVACYTLHNAPLFCCVWSPFSPSLVITAGHEGLIRIWDIQEQQAKLPVLKTKDGNHLHKEAKEAKSLHGGMLPLVCDFNCYSNTFSMPHPVSLADSSGISVESPKSKEKKREKAVLPLSGPSLHKDESNIEILKYLLHPSGMKTSRLQIHVYIYKYTHIYIYIYIYLLCCHFYSKQRSKVLSLKEKREVMMGKHYLCIMHFLPTRQLSNSI